MLAYNRTAFQAHFETLVWFGPPVIINDEWASIHRRLNCPAAKGLIRDTKKLPPPVFEEASCSCCGENALHFAARLEQVQTMQCLLSNKMVHVNATNAKGETPLHLACAGDRTEIVQILLDAGATPNVFDDLGRSPLYICIDQNKPEFLQELLSHRIELNNFFSARLNKEIKVDDLIHTCITVNKRNDKGKTMLYDAVLVNDAKLVKQLLEDGSDVHLRYDSETILHVACSVNAMECMSILLASGVQVNAVDKFGMTALHYAAESTDVVKVRLLLANGCDVDAQDLRHRSPLEIAVNGGSPAVVRCLLEHNPCIRTSKIMPQTIKRGIPDIVNSFLQHGINANSRDNDKKTLLQLAVVRGNVDIVRLLLDNGADIKVKGPKDSPLINAAILKPDVRMVQLLVEYGADICSKDVTGMPPIVHAMRKKQYDIADILFERGGCRCIVDEALLHPGFRRYKTLKNASRYMRP